MFCRNFMLYFPARRKNQCVNLTQILITKLWLIEKIKKRNTKIEYKMI